MAFVLDCSVALSWYFKDEATDRTNELRERIMEEQLFVPALWPLEITNALLAAYRRKRIVKNDLANILSDLRELPSEVDRETDAMVWEHSLHLAQRHRLSIYNATYLELALRKQASIATLDKELIRASKSAGVKVLT